MTPCSNDSSTGSLPDGPDRKKVGSTPSSKVIAAPPWASQRGTQRTGSGSAPTCLRRARGQSTGRHRSDIRPRCSRCSSRRWPSRWRTTAPANPLRWPERHTRAISPPTRVHFGLPYLAALVKSKSSPPRPSISRQRAGRKASWCAARRGWRASGRAQECPCS
jgi:hypothetical protein